MVKKIRMISAVGIVLGTSIAFHRQYDWSYRDFHFIIGVLLLGVSGLVHIVVRYFFDKE